MDQRGRIRMSLAVCLVVSGLGLAATPTPEPRPETAPSVLLGRWAFNKELSEDPAWKLREAMERGRGMEPGMGGMGGRGGSWPGREGMRSPDGGMGLFGEPPLDGARSEPPADAPEDPGPQGRRRPRGPAPSPILIFEDDSGALALSSEHAARLLRPDGKKYPKDGPEGQTFEQQTRWEKGRLVVKTNSEWGAGRTEKYRVREDGRLEIEIEMQGGLRMPNVKFKLVYDHAPVPPA